MSRTDNVLFTRAAKRLVTEDQDVLVEGRQEVGRQNSPRLSAQLSKPPLGPSALGDPYLTNDRIIAQILQPVSLPSSNFVSPAPGRISDPENNIPSLLEREHIPNANIYPSPSMSAGFGASMQTPFPQPNLGHLSEPVQQTNMEMLLQAVSTSHWVEPSFHAKPNFGATQSVPQASDPVGTSSTYRSSQIPTGYISLGLPSPAMVPEQAQVEDGIADVFGWGVNSVEWMQLYDSVGMDSNLVAPAETTYPAPPPRYAPAVKQSYSATQQSIAVGSPVWVVDQNQPQLHRQPVPAVPFHPTTTLQRRSSAQAYQITHSPLEFSPHGTSGEYILPSELPNEQEAYPSRTSMINRDIQMVSGNNRTAGLGDMRATSDSAAGRNTRPPTNEVVYGEDGTPWVSR